MKRPFLKTGLIVATLGLAAAGCSQTGQKSSTSSKKPADPTAWTDSDVSKSSTSSLPQSSRLSGGWSSESREIENSLGVGR